LRPDVAPDGAGVFARTFSHGLRRGLQDIARFAGSEPRIHTKLPNPFVWKSRNSRPRPLAWAGIGSGWRKRSDVRPIHIREEILLMPLNCERGRFGNNNGG
jgi:hypothetical protein